MRSNRRSIRLAATAAATALLTRYAAGPAHAATAATWLSPTTGTWINASLWSSAPYYPNNGNPAGTIYDATLDAAGSAYTAQLNSDVSLNSLTLNSPNATLSQAAGTLTSTQPLNLLAGTYRLAGGTLNNLTVCNPSGAAQFVVPADATAATLSGVTLDSDLSLLTPAILRTILTATNGLTLANGHRITLNNSSSSGGSILRLIGSQTLGGTGEVVFDGTYTTYEQRVATESGSVTFGPNITIRTGAQGGTIGGKAISSGTAGSWVNLGTISAQTPGAALTLSGPWSNQGTLNLSAGTLLLAGSFSTPGIGTLHRTGGTLMLTGSLDNAGHTLTLDSSTGPWVLNGGTITGGTVRALPGGGLTSTNGGVLNSVILDGQFAFNALSIAGDLTLAPGSSLTANDSTTAPDLVFLSSGPHSLKGTGTVILNADYINPGGSGTGTAALTVDPGITVTVSAGRGGFANGSLVNSGTIWSATPGTYLDLNTRWANQGVLKLTDGTLALGGIFTTAGIGTLQRTGGTLVVTGALDNSNATLALNTATGSWNLSGGGSITGGAITTSQGTAFHVTYMGPSGPNFTLDNVSVDTDLSVDASASLVLTGTTALTPGHRLLLTQSSVSFAAGQTFSGGIDFQSAPFRSAVYPAYNSTLTLGPSAVIRSSTGSGDLGRSDTNFSPWSIDNRGLISAEAPGQTLSINPGRFNVGNFTNNATIQAINGGTLELGGHWDNKGTILVDHGTLLLGGVFSAANIGTLNATAATVKLTGALNNAGSTLALSPARFGSLTLADRGQIIGGTVTTSGGARLVIASPAPVTGGPIAPVLDAVTLAGEAVITGPYANEYFIDHGLHLDNGILRLSSTSSSLFVTMYSQATVDGTGQIVFDGSTPNTFRPGLGALTIGPGITVRTGTNSGTVGASGLPLVNQGAISAGTINQSITLAGALTNTGTITASNGGSVYINGPLLTTAGLGSFSGTTGRVVLQGTLDNSDPAHPLTLSASTGPLHLGNNASVTGGTVSSPDATPLVASTGTSTLDGVDLRTDVNILAGAILQFAHGATAAGRTFSLYSAGNFTALKAAAGEALPANITVSFETTSASNLVTSLPGYGLVVPATDTIRTGAGAGSVGTIGTPLTNSGLISAETPGQFITVAGLNWTNLGTLQAKNGATLNLGGTFTPASIGTLVITDGSPVNIAGSLDATANPLTLSASLPLGIAGGTIKGTVNSSDGTPLIARGTACDLFAATVNVPVSVLPGATLAVDNNTTLNAPVSITGAGSRLTLTGPWTNTATISATAGATIALAGTPPANISDISLNGSTLTTFGTAYKTANLAHISFTNSTILVANQATFDNSNDTLSLSPGTVTLTVSGGTLRGGTVTGPANTPVVALAGGSLSGVTLAADAQLLPSTTTSVANGLTLDHAHLSLQGGTIATGTAALSFSGAQTLAGTGDVSFDGTTGSNAVRPSSVIGSLTIAPNITIHTGTQGGTVGNASRAPLVLQGSISAQTAGKTLTVIGSTVTNSGSLSASNGSSLVVDATSFTNTGTITVGPSSTLLLANAAASAPLGTLSLSGTALLNYTAASPIDSVRQQLAAGSVSTPLANMAVGYAEASQLLSLTGSQTAIYANQVIDATTLILVTTFSGDANVNGRIDPDDYALLDRSYARSLSGVRWSDGDFNYDGRVTSADYLLIDAAYLRQQGGTPSPAFLAQREARFGDGYVAQLVSSVPEPSACGFLILSLAPLARRCRRRPS